LFTLSIPFVGIGLISTAILQAYNIFVDVGDSGAGGTKGLVPAPTTGDATKYLKGDGTWASPAGAGSADFLHGLA
jgi:hypothetical protein